MNRVVVMCAGLLLVGCLTACDRAKMPANNEARTASAEAEAKKLLAQVMAALNGNDFAAVKALYAPDAIMITPGSPPFKGTHAIGAEYDRLAADPAVRFTGMPGAIQISSSRDLAYADATYKMTYTNPQTSKVESGNGYCLWVFRRQQDRSWKIVRDVSSAVPTVG